MVIIRVSLQVDASRYLCDMAIDMQAFHKIIAACRERQATLVAVSKTKPPEDISELYKLGHRDFGENYVQELSAKHEALPKDIRWHFIGHLQSNKVKYIAPFVHLVHGVDSEKLLIEINKQAAKNDRVIDCLLQVHIAMEETKFGFDGTELMSLLQKQLISDLKNIRVRGLMGMASFTTDMQVVENEFKNLKSLYDTALATVSSIDTLSMGMSADYELALQCGSNMIRVGSLLFGART
jgi:pyridoxal phosphate enzyme (YggS family)